MPLCLAIYRQTHISMTNNNNQVSVTYTDAELRNLIEEFIAQRKEEFSLRDACSCVLYCAVEDGKVVNIANLIESYILSNDDQVRVKMILESIISDGRIVLSTDEACSKSKK